MRDVLLSRTFFMNCPRGEVKDTVALGLGLPTSIAPTWQSPIVDNAKV